MKKILFGLVLTLVACGQTTNKQEQAEITNFDEHVGVYEYVNPNSAQDLNENHYIVLTKTNETLTGFYYGTSDEFDRARAGYPPGFFVSPMHCLKISSDTIKFLLNTKNSEFFTQPIDLNIQSTEEAISSGYKKWVRHFPTNPKRYIGLIKDSASILFEDNFKGDREFKKIK